MTNLSVMHLASPRGQRTRLSYAEVAEAIGFNARQILRLVSTGRLVRRFEGSHPFDVGDVNTFIQDFNAGRISLGRTRKSREHAQEVGKVGAA